MRKLDNTVRQADRQKVAVFKSRRALSLTAQRLSMVRHACVVTRLFGIKLSETTTQYLPTLLGGN